MVECWLLVAVRMAVLILGLLRCNIHHLAAEVPEAHVRVLERVVLTGLVAVAHRGRHRLIALDVDAWEAARHEVRIVCSLCSESCCHL